jgi:S-adenosylmethionine hydrolase
MLGNWRARLQPVVSLLTDFGLMDPFVAEMKGVILSICPDANLIDISHLVEKFNVRMGAFLLAAATPYFPHGTVHLAVVDPGVGSKRQAIVIETIKYLFVGPDNGLMIPAATIDGILHVYHLTNRSLLRDDISSTFHGRDIFASAAAHLACGTAPKECGAEVKSYAKPEFTKTTLKGRTVACSVLYVDSFGDVITNLPQAELSKLNLKLGAKIPLAVGRRSVSARFVQTYSDLNRGEIGILTGSHGFLELACREASAAKRVRVRRGSVVRVYGG